jgi:hypothetical protein
MSVVRLCALEALSEVLVEAIPELDGQVCIGVPPNTHEQTYPSMTINPVRWKFQPEEIEELDMGSSGLSVRRVGTHEGMIQIRVLATTPGQRDELASRVVDVFAGFEDEDGCPHPGTILARVTECGAVPWTACFDLDRDEWINQRAFESKYEALIEVDAAIPALVTKPGVYSIQTLQLGFTSDFTTTYSASTMLASAAVEVVQINEDGSLEPYDP